MPKIAFKHRCFVLAWHFAHYKKVGKRYGVSILFSELHKLKWPCNTVNGSRTKKTDSQTSETTLYNGQRTLYKVFPRPAVASTHYTPENKCDAHFTWWYIGNNTHVLRCSLAPRYLHVAPTDTREMRSLLIRAAKREIFRTPTFFHVTAGRNTVSRKSLTLIYRKLCAYKGTC